MTINRQRHNRGGPRPLPQQRLLSRMCRCVVNAMFAIAACLPCGLRAATPPGRLVPATVEAATTELTSVEVVTSRAATAPQIPVRAMPGFTAPTRRAIVVGMPTAKSAGGGEITMLPNVQLSDGAPNREAWPIVTGPINRQQPYEPDFALPLSNQPQATRPIEHPMPWVSASFGVPQQGEALPTPINGGNVEMLPDGAIVYGEAEPVFGQMIHEVTQPPRLLTLDRIWKYLTTVHRPMGDVGIGRDRVGVAPFEIEATQPFNNFQVRLDGAWNLERPDRSEYFWARPKLLGGMGPPRPERRVNYQEIRFRYEIALPRFSTTTEIPIIAVDPAVNPNTAGMGDVRIATKLLMIDGETWQVSQLFGTFIKAGAASHGTSTGHTSIEPGFAFRYRWNPDTYIHSDVKWRVPLGAHPIHAGGVLKYGIGVSHVFMETDSYAVMPTLELVGWSFLEGLSTPYDPAFPENVIPENVDPEGIFNIQPGVRFVKDNDGDLGLFELGMSTGFTVTGNHLYSGLVRLDLRWTY